MTEQRNDGGPAFPVNYSNERDGPTVMPTPGMTLRDYFAAKAMQAMLAAQIKALGDATIPNVAKDAYRMADGMLKARDE